MKINYENIIMKKFRLRMYKLNSIKLDNSVIIILNEMKMDY